MSNVIGHELDSMVRAPLWELGYDYPHETGHGVGAFGRIVEGIKHELKIKEIKLKRYCSGNLT